MRHSRAALAVLSLVIVAASVTKGQAADRRPSTTPNPLRSVATDPTIEPVLTRDLASLLESPPVVITSPRWRVLTIFAPALSVFASERQLTQALTGCRSQLPTGVEPAAFAASNRPWAAFDSAASGQPLVVFSIASNAGPGVACGDTVVDQAYAVARGLEFVFPAFLPEKAPVTATVSIGGVNLVPSLYGKARVLRVRGVTSGRDSTQQLRFYVPIDDLRPDSTGRFPATRLQIVTVSNKSDTIQIPERILRQVWSQALAWRLERANQNTAPSAPDLDIPLPADPIVAQSVTALRAGNRAEAARRALRGLTSNNLDTRRYARVLVGTTLLTGGDTAASSVIMAQALEDDQCLASSPTANPLVRGSVLRLREAEVCVTRSPASVFARGLVFPGQGQAGSGRRGTSIAIATAGTFAASALLGMRSRQLYHSYRSATTTSDAVNRYDSAAKYRMMATGVAVTGMLVWAGSAVEAAVRQSSKNTSIRRVSAYGGGRQ